eukprot:TRINITY_DN35447_c0_g1_i1.p1 TRINITY_DN35447_c0_g1~~TRINITY_DN35447_c0_g1_i1.p1  ORF type:complete len:245 (+),score=53.84 TRINITY_DN35447_c0_g1_i1:236-970(+)
METRFSGSLKEPAGLGLDVEDEGDECRQKGCKKKRLSIHQVRSLEMNFEIENKLEPERKLQIAQELGLQPRQVAIWFQNRRARWKTKQLEKEYGLLKLNYDTLKSKFDSVQRDNQKLTAQVVSLKEKLEQTQELKRSENGGSSRGLQPKQFSVNALGEGHLEMYESEGSSGILTEQYEMNTNINSTRCYSVKQQDLRMVDATVTLHGQAQANEANTIHEESCNLFNNNVVDNPAALAFQWWEWS